MLFKDEHYDRVHKESIFLTKNRSAIASPRIYSLNWEYAGLLTLAYKLNKNHEYISSELPRELGRKELDDLEETIQDLLIGHD